MEMDSLDCDGRNRDRDTQEIGTEDDWARLDSDYKRRRRHKREETRTNQKWTWREESKEAMKGA